MSTFLQQYSRVLDYTHRPKYQDAIECKALVNEAYIHIVGRLACYQVTTAPLPMTAGNGNYSIVTDLGVSDFSTLRIVKYTASSGATTLNTLAPTAPDEIVAMRQINPSATSPAITYALSGWDIMMLHPLPTTGDTLTLTYGAVPAAMVADSDTPTRLPQEWHHLIVQRAAATAFEVVDDQRALAHQAAFEAELKRCRLWFAMHASSRGYAPSVDSNHEARIWPGQYYSTIG